MFCVHDPHDPGRLRQSASGAARAAAAVALLAVVAACSSTAVFQSSFGSKSPGSDPSGAQSVGTLSAFGDPGDVVVVAPPPTATSGDNWVQMTRPNNQAQLPGITCTLDQEEYSDTFTLSASLFIPSGSGLATIGFYGGVDDNIGWFHIDFLEDNTVRLDDNPATVFGGFPRNHVFSVFVSIDSRSAPATASISLFGTGATGSSSYNLQASPAGLGFSSVHFFIGYPWTGSFDVADVVVSSVTSN